MSDATQPVSHARDDDGPDDGPAATAALASTWSTVDGRRMHARRSTTEPPAGRLPVVLVHGLGVSSRYMIPTARALAPDFRVWAPDLPGFGRSARPPQALNIPGLVDALAAWMDAAGIERAALLGNSLGCQVIVSFALRHPHRITRGVLVGPTGDPATRNAARVILRAARDLVREPLSLYPILAYDYLVAGPARVWRTFEYLLADHIDERLPRVQAPMLVVRGRRDTIVPQTWVEEAARRLPNGRLAVVDGAAHAVNYSAPAALARLTRSFLLDAAP